MLPSILGAPSQRAATRPTTTMPAAARERMSRVDTAWLRMDNDVNLMMIVGVWLLQPKIAYETLCSARRREAAEVRALPPGGGARRRPAPPTGSTTRASTSTITSCARSSSAPRGRASARRCRRASASWRATPLDPDRPLWQFRLIESYDGGSALIARVHHCIGDGIALISVMMTITDGGSDPPVRKRRAAAERRRRRRRLARPRRC